MVGENPADYFSSDGDAGGIGLNADGDVVLGSLCTTITLNPNGGTLPEYSLVEGAALPIPTKTGYTFAGWYESPEFSGNPVTDIPTNSTENLNFYAKWTVNTYIVIFDANGGSGDMTPQSFTYGTVQNLTQNTFTKVGCTFTGWNTVKDGTGTFYEDGADGSHMPAQNNGTVTLYAQWRANTYQISYQGVENTAGLPTTHTYGTDTQIPDPAKPGYTFTGWLVNNDGEPQKNLTLGGSDYTANITLTAQWTAIPSSGGSSDPTYSITLPSRVTGGELPYGQLLRISGLRVFGNGEGPKPAQAEAAGARVDALDATITWKHIENAQGCNVRYGVAPDKLYLSWLVYDTDEVTLSTLTAGQEYYVCVDSFNENGITPGKIFKLEG